MAPSASAGGGGGSSGGAGGGGGFSVGATKKGELPLKVEKRARGKRVTIIANVQGDASKLASALQSMLGVGGTARRGERGAWTVEVQGDQTARVVGVLLDLKCLQGLSPTALEAVRAQQAPAAGSRGESAVARTAASKFLAQTQAGRALSPEEERRKALELESDFYDRYFQSAGGGMHESDLSDVFGEIADAATSDAVRPPAREMPVEELNRELNDLGMLAVCGRAVREFWETSGMTVAQFRKMALNPGARLVTDGTKRKLAPSNLVSRQKLSDWRSTGGRARGSYFAAPVSAIDAYERGLSPGASGMHAKQDTVVAEKRLKVSTDGEGWHRAAVRYFVPLAPPPSRLEPGAAEAASRRCLERLWSGRLAESLEELRSSKLPGLGASLSSDAFALDLAFNEHDFLFGPKVEGSKPADKPDKEELRVEKKLREICALKRRELEGEALEKLQVEKVERRGELFEELAEMKLARAEKEVAKLVKQCQPEFKDMFWESEWEAMYGDGQSTAASSTAGAGREPPRDPNFGLFDEARSEGAAISVSEDALEARSRGARWAGLPLRLEVGSGEVGAFAVEVLEGSGVVRLGWLLAASRLDGGSGAGEFSDLGASPGGFGFGGTGKKVSAGAFDSYGESFGPGDVIHCEAEREDGRLRVGFAKNDEPLGVAFDVEDKDGNAGLVGVVCGKAFQVRLLSAECMPLEEAPGLDTYVEFDPPRMAVAIRDAPGEGEDALPVYHGETIHVSSSDGRGWLFGYFLDPEDPDDGGWLEEGCIRFLDEADEVAGESWSEAPGAAHVPDDAGSAPVADDAGWGAPPLAPNPGTSAASTASARKIAAPSAAAAAAGEGGVQGLAEWLKGLSLSRHEAQAEAWCAEMGAVSLDEVLENWEEFADAMSLKPLERKRLAKAVAR